MSIKNQPFTQNTAGHEAFLQSMTILVQQNVEECKYLIRHFIDDEDSVVPKIAERIEFELKNPAIVAEDEDDRRSMLIAKETASAIRYLQVFFKENGVNAEIPMSHLEMMTFVQVIESLILKIHQEREEHGTGKQVPALPTPNEWGMPVAYIEGNGNA